MLLYQISVLDWPAIRLLYDGHAKNQSKRLVEASEIHLGELQPYMAASDEIPRIAVTTVNVSSPKPDSYHLKLLRNYENPDDKREEDRKASEWYLHEMAQATSAAPTHFDVFRKDDNDYIDGGLQANCPLGALLNDINNLYSMEEQKRHIGGILSIGTGDPENPNEEKGKEKKGNYTTSFSKTIPMLAVRAITVEFSVEGCGLGNYLRIGPIFRLLNRLKTDKKRFFFLIYARKFTIFYH